MRSEVDLARVQDIPQPLVGTICDRRVDDQHQTRLESSPQTTVPIFTIDHLFRSREHAFLLPLRLRLLPRSHDRNWDREQLRQRTSHGSETQLHSGASCLTTCLHFAQIQRPHSRVPVKVGKVCARDAEQTASHAAV
jgi:hypothetical protein